MEMKSESIGYSGESATTRNGKYAERRIKSKN